MIIPLTPEAEGYLKRLATLSGVTPEKYAATVLVAWLDTQISIKSALSAVSLYHTGEVQ